MPFDIGNDEVDAVIVVDPQDTVAIAQEISQYPEFAVDVETSSLDFKTGKIHGLSLATETKEWYVTLGAELAMLDHLRDLVKDRLVINHNIGFDMHFLKPYGVRPTRIADTMIAQYLIDENQSLGLKSLSHTKLGMGDLPDFKDLLRLGKKLTKKKKLEDVNIYDIPIDKLAVYGARDSRLAMTLWKKSQYELEQEGMTEIFWKSKMPFVFVLTDMEESGFFIDQALLNDLNYEFVQARDEALARFDTISGGVNPGSPQQVANYFYNTLGYATTLRTQGGAPSVDVMALTRLRQSDTTGAVEALLTYRKYEKLINTYVVSFQEKLFNGRLYGSFNQIGDSTSASGDRLPRTGRLSSSSPNLQNIPARGAAGARVRELFSAAPGNVFLDIDYSQLELRIAAHYTRDPNMIKVFEEGGDPHQMTADLCNVARHIGKTANFLVFYGGGPIKFADTLEKNGYPRPSVGETKDWLRRWDQAYPAVPAWKRRVVDYAYELGYIKTVGGRKRRLPDIRSRDDSLRGSAERQAVNTIIQGSAADIVEYAMIQIYPYQAQFSVPLLAQVHDELAWEPTEEAVDEFAKLASEKMKEAGEHFNLRVKLEAKPEWGPNWAKAKK